MLISILMHLSAGFLMAWAQKSMRRWQMGHMDIHGIRTLKQGRCAVHATANQIKSDQKLTHRYIYPERHTYACVRWTGVAWHIHSFPFPL
ncbi:hypothetical protein DFH27DRAFT_538065 [Peziza echinospora]|nr:hypothetical protein DFH27DRAFT_538065 [Peziza echinospora]